ncbi:hypothetical protein JS562_54570, partial [Agrobacterium sp. S2]|nr:hypothetical protein [Agrobacterium sp. S2]
MATREKSAAGKIINLFRRLSHFSKKFSRFCHFPVAFQNRLSDIAPVAASAAHGSAYYPGPVDLSGCSSGVEHNLAK